MNVLFIVLNDLAYLDEILETFVEIKVRGATIIESQGMASAILHSEGMNFLMQGLFKGRTDEEQKYSKTIFTVIPDEEKLKETVAAVQKIVERSKKRTIGFMFTVPVTGIYPLSPKVK
jgi:nitrogen regulatory protein PII